TQYDNVRIGLNSRLDTIQAAILLEKLAILEDEMEARDRIAKRYNELLKDVVKVPGLPAGNRSAWAQYSIESENRDGLKAHLQAAGVPSVIYYVKPLHLQTAYKHYPIAPGGLPVSEALPARILSLPMHPYLSEEDQDKIIGAIRGFHGK
ncbi:DegT/DnrJ/EryC1/StrS family aminotransferase, partial [Cellulomonas iranensis]